MVMGQGCGLSIRGSVVQTPSPVVFIHSTEFSLVWDFTTADLLLLNLGHMWFTAKISSAHRVVMRDEIHVLCDIALCAVESHCSLRNTLHSPYDDILTITFPKSKDSHFFDNSKLWNLIPKKVFFVSSKLAYFELKLIKFLHSATHWQHVLQLF
jgi:hypothetical protein